MKAFRILNRSYLIAVVFYNIIHLLIFKTFKNHLSNKITVYFSPQYKKKALELRTMPEDAVVYFDRKLKVKMKFTLTS